LKVLAFFGSDLDPSIGSDFSAMGTIHEYGGKLALHPDHRRNSRHNAVFETLRMIEREHTAANYMLVVLLAAFILRLSVPLIAFETTKDKNVFCTTDTSGYLQPAMNLISSGQYIVDGLPEIFRPPGYPVFLIPGLLLGRPELLTIACQIILSCLTVFLVYKIALTLFERTDVAIAAAGLYGLEPLSVVYTSLIMAETLFAFMMMLSIYLIIRYLKERQFTFVCMAALVLSATTYVRPVAYLLPIIIVTFILAASAVRNEIRKKLLIHICTFLVIAMAPLFAWQARNKIEAGYSGFSATTDEFIFLSGQSVSASLQGISVTEQKKRSGWSHWNSPSRYYSQHPEHLSLDPGTILRHRRDEGLRLILENPWQYLQAHARGTFLMGGLTGLGTWLVMFKAENPESAFRMKLRDPSSLGFVSHFFSSGGIIVWGNILLGAMLLMYWFFVIFALFSRNVRNKLEVILLVTVAAYFLIAPGAWAESRYRHPVMPTVCVLAGYGLCYFLVSIRRRENMKPLSEKP
jgi:4-amino-4-deoxy-L-arabinose transferase-like glycosyltransferase